jgi:hypothetical protein
MRQAHGHGTEALRFDEKGMVELAEEVLIRDRERQLDELLRGVMRGEPREEFIADVLRAQRDLVRVLERKLLALVVPLARLEVVDLDELLIVDPVVSADRRIQVRSERTTVQPGDPDADERLLSERKAPHLTVGRSQSLHCP